jgi:hypothetical protein
MLARLIYTSMVPSLRAGDVADILRASRTNNAATGVTGALCHLDGAYMQYLEGDDLVLDKLYAVIERDARHASPRVLDRSFLAVRTFPDWSMALLRWDERIKAVFYAFSSPQPLALYRTPAQQAAPMFRALARTPNWATL